jgi:hypothetical protein
MVEKVVRVIDAGGDRNYFEKFIYHNSLPEIILNNLQIIIKEVYISCVYVMIYRQCLSNT